MKKNIGLLIAFIVVLGLMTTTAGCAGPVKNEKQLQSATADMQETIQSKLSDLDNALSDAAVKIAKSGLTGPETRQILEGLCKKYPYLADCATADLSGTMVTVAPETYRRYEGTNTSKNDVTAEFNENKKPLLSNQFRAVEGFDAMVLARPVLTEKGELMGSVGVLFKPETLLDSIIKPRAEAGALKVNVMQTDGLVIYCSTGAGTNKNVLTDPSYKAYPELIAQAAKIALLQSGSGGYTYPSVTTGQPVKKTVFWTSVGLHGTEWRIVSITEFDK